MCQEAEEEKQVENLLGMFFKISVLKKESTICGMFSEFLN